MKSHFSHFPSFPRFVLALAICCGQLDAKSFAATAAADTPMPPQTVGPPTALQAVTNRAFTGIPSMAVSPRGRLWATWYAGPTPGEDHNNYVVLSTSGDDGRTWNEVLVVDPDEAGPRRAFDPELWIAPDGKLRWTWADRVGADSKTDGLWMLLWDDPDSEASSWAQPVRIAQGVMMCKPLALSSGEWMLPVCTWFTERSSKAVVSVDQGRTWEIRGGATIPKEHRLFDEHMFIERKDKSLWILARTKYGIGESVSTDRGVTWTELQPSKLKHPSARFFIRRLASGNLLLVKHGPLFTQTGRSHLTAYVSQDDGATWEGGLVLDKRAGVSYPDGQQDNDGLIRIIYDFDRTGARQILMASFREKDVLSGNADSPTVSLRAVASQGSKEVQVNANSDGTVLDTSAKGLLEVEGVMIMNVKQGTVLFTDRQYELAEWPDELAGATLLRIPMDGGKRVRCTRSGTVLMLTPTPERNRDSQTQILLGQGFTKVRLPEVRLFNPYNTRNFCTTYQKVCAENEEITIGKWAVPVMLP